MRNPNARVPLEFEPTCSGDRYHIDYQPIIEDGCIQLIEAGRTDIQAVIDSYADSCDMNLILQRLSIGDTSVLNPKTPMFGDFTVCPSTLSGLLNLKIEAQRVFDNLDPVVRDQFVDFNDWLAASGSQEWLTKMQANPVNNSVSEDSSAADRVAEEEVSA